MRVALLLVTAVGIALGLAVPARRPAPTAMAAVAADQPVETVLQRDPRGHFIAFAQVNGELVRFVVDTGASTVALTADDAARAHVAVEPGAYVTVGQGASGEVRGQMVKLGSVALGGKRVEDLSAVVLPDVHVSLLGQNYLRHLSVSIRDDTMTLR